MSKHKLSDTDSSDSEATRPYSDDDHYETYRKLYDENSVENKSNKRRRVEDSKPVSPVENGVDDKVGIQTADILQKQIGQDTGTLAAQVPTESRGGTVGSIAVASNNEGDSDAVPSAHGTRNFEFDDQKTACADKSAEAEELSETEDSDAV